MPALDPADVLIELWRDAGLDDDVLDDVVFTGTEPVLPSSFAVGTAAQATIGAAALAAARRIAGLAVQEAKRGAHCFNLVKLAINDRIRVVPPSFEYDSSYWCESGLMSDHTAFTRIALSFTV